MNVIEQLRADEAKTAEARGAALEKLREVLRKGDKATKPDVDAARAAAADLGLTSDHLALLRAMLAEGEALRAELESVPEMRERVADLESRLTEKRKAIAKLSAAAKELYDERASLIARAGFSEMNPPGQLRALHRASGGIVPLHGVPADGSEDLPRGLHGDGELARLYRAVNRIPDDVGVQGPMRPVLEV